MTTEPQDTAALVRENRRLREALVALLDEVDASPANIDTAPARDLVPDQPGSEIQPPWVREGYDSKDEWLDAQGAP